MDKTALKEKLKGIKHKEIVLAVIAVFVMLVIYFSSYLKSDKSNISAVEEQDYCSQMQQTLTEAIAGLSGESSVKVIINWVSGVEKIIAYTEGTSSRSPAVVQSGPIILKTVNPKAIGVAVVVKSADTALKLDIMQLVSTLLDISPEKVAVYSKK